MKQVVVDANILIKRVIPEKLSDLACALLNQFRQDQVQMIAPAFFLAEVDSILRKKVIATKELTAAQAQISWEDIQLIPVKPMEMTPLRAWAWEISIKLRQAHVYDAVYLALAESVGCDFWTADEKLIKATKTKFSFVKSLKDFIP